MTDKKHLKRRVRDRQARTGESYMTALRHVQAQRPPSIAVVEMIDLTELGATLDFKCRVAMYPTLADQIDPARALARLRDLLAATDLDGGLALIRGVVMLGERPRIRLTAAGTGDLLRFIRRARAGLGGVTQRGDMLVLQVEAARGPLMVMFKLSLTPQFAQVTRAPSLVLLPVPDADGDPIFRISEAP